LLESGAHWADLQGANLAGADLRKAELQAANLSFATLVEANMEGAKMATTILGANDLSRVRGLESVRHSALSIVGIETIYRSNGAIPEAFLRGCGVPDRFITYARSLVTNALDFHSCFISYSGRDEEFARRLHSRMREAELRVWFAPEDMRGGDKLYDQIDRAIQVHDRLRRYFKPCLSLIISTVYGRGWWRLFAPVAGPVWPPVKLR
jgi:hypothetical protein